MISNYVSKASRFSAQQDGITRKDTYSMTPKVIGLFAGLVLGIVWMWLGFWAALLAAGLALVGWFIGSLIEGTIVPTDVWNALQGRRGDLE